MRTRSRAPHRVPAAPAAVKAIEARINHDVKAVEYYVREELQRRRRRRPATLELVHFACTSEDINNLSYALHARRGARQLLQETLAQARIGGAEAARAALRRLADAGAHPRPAGQPHHPRQGVRELRGPPGAGRAPLRCGGDPGQVERRGRQLQRPRGGAARARLAAAVAASFVASLQLEYNPWTTQIEPHDWIAEYCDALAAVNVILIDLCRDFWGYISLGYLRQRAVAGEVGSSTMPHKVNPIDFENAEGNCGVANALLRHFSEKLPLSRWQRDLTDSTVLRNLGVALGHTLIAWSALGRGLAKVEADPQRMAQDLEGAWEVLGEAVQTVLRAAGVADGYERLKEFTRGRAIDGPDARRLHRRPAAAGAREGAPARRSRPSAYTGLAAQLARGV